MVDMAHKHPIRHSSWKRVYIWSGGEAEGVVRGPANKCKQLQALKLDCTRPRRLVAAHPHNEPWLLHLSLLQARVPNSFMPRYILHGRPCAIAAAGARGSRCFLAPPQQKYHLFTRSVGIAKWKRLKPAYQKTHQRTADPAICPTVPAPGSP